MINTTVALKSNLDLEVIQPSSSSSPAIFSNTTTQPLLDQNSPSEHQNSIDLSAVQSDPNSEDREFPSVRYVSDDFYTINRSYVRSSSDESVESMVQQVLHFLDHLLSLLLWIPDYDDDDEMVDTGIDNGINLLCESFESYMARSISSRRIQRLGRSRLYFQAGFVPYPVKSSWWNGW